MQRESSANSNWGALKDSTLVQFATNFLSHNIKLLSVFVHVIEQREPESRDKVSAALFSCGYRLPHQNAENSNWSVTEKTRKYRNNISKQVKTFTDHTRVIEHQTTNSTQVRKTEEVTIKLHVLIFMQRWTRIFYTPTTFHEAF